MAGMGFVKAADWLQYEFEISPEVPEKFVKDGETGSGKIPFEDA